MEVFWRANASANGWKLSKKKKIFIELQTVIDLFLADCILKRQLMRFEQEQNVSRHHEVDVCCSDSFNESIKTSG